MEITSDIRSTPSVSLIQLEHLQQLVSRRRLGVKNDFLSIANAILRGNDATFNRGQQPLSGLDAIGDDLSIIVKRSAKWEE